MQMSWIPKNVNVNAAFSNANAIEPKADLYSNNCDVWCEDRPSCRGWAPAERRSSLSVVRVVWFKSFDLNHWFKSQKNNNWFMIFFFTSDFLIADLYEFNTYNCL